MDISDNMIQEEQEQEEQIQEEQENISSVQPDSISENTISNNEILIENSDLIENFDQEILETVLSEQTEVPNLISDQDFQIIEIILLSAILGVLLMSLFLKRGFGRV